MAALKLIAVMYAVLLLVCIALITQCRKAEADHSVYLPLVPNTPMMQSIKATQEVLWCVNDRAAAYPNFVGQLIDVNDQYTQRTGIKHRQVAWGTPFGVSVQGQPQTGCQEQHNMVWGLQCGGCAAQVFFANWPVVTEYKEDLLMIDLRTAIGHEEGHDRLGLGEMYRDSGGVIQCDTNYQAMLNRLGFESVMSCGTGVKYPTATDVSRGCAILLTSWCGRAPDPPPCGNPCWNPQIERWQFSDGWSWEPRRDWWFNPAGIPEWMSQGCCGDRWNDVTKAWHFPDGRMFFPQTGIWSRLP